MYLNGCYSTSTYTKHGAKREIKSSNALISSLHEFSTKAKIYVIIVKKVMGRDVYNAAAGRPSGSQSFHSGDSKGLYKKYEG